MRAAEVLVAAQVAGVAIAVEGTDLILAAPAPPPPDVLNLIKAHKIEIIRLLSGGAVPWGWARGIAVLSTMPAPRIIPAERWRQIVRDASAFLVGWGRQAAAFGWETLDIFGAHKERPLARYDAAGLVLLLDRATVVAMTVDIAEIRNRSGARQQFVRHPFKEPGQVPLWELEG